MTVAERAAKLEGALRQRVAKERQKRRVTDGDRRALDGGRAAGARSRQEAHPMTDPFGRPRYVKEREVWYDELPPDLAPPVDELEGDDHDLDDADDLAGDEPDEREA